jgi:hypothetical protein
MFFAPEVSPRNKHRLGITFDKGFVSYFVWADLITLCCFRPLCSGRTFPIFAVRTISMHALNLLTTLCSYLRLVLANLGVGLGDKKRAKAGVGPWLEAEGYSAKLCPRLDV